MSSGGPDEGGVGAVGVIAVGISPRVDEAVWSCSRFYHGRLGFEVAFGSGGGGESG